MAGSTIELNDKDFRTKVLQSATPVLVDFWAPWCGPCKMIAPMLEELAGEFAGRLIIGKMDIMQNPQTTADFGIRSIPALLLFKDGKVAETIMGAAPKGKLQEKIKSALGG